jgi:hypothetical protein
MRTFTFENGVITPGWKLQKNNGNFHVVLGEEGEGKWRSCLPVAYGHAKPAIGEGDMIFDCCVHSYQGRPWITSACCKPQCALLLIRTKGGAEMKREGRAKIFNGYEQKQKLLRGRGFNGNDPKLGIWKDYVFLVHPGNGFSIYVGGTLKIFRVGYQSGTFSCDEVGQVQPAPLQPLNGQTVGAISVKEPPQPPLHLRGYKKRLWLRANGFAQAA